MGALKESFYTVYNPSSDKSYCNPVTKNEVVDELVGEPAVATAGLVILSYLCPDPTYRCDTLDLVTTDKIQLISFKIRSYFGPPENNVYYDSVLINVKIKCDTSTKMISTFTLTDWTLYQNSTSADQLFFAPFTCTFPACCENVKYTITSEMSGVNAQ